MRPRLASLALLLLALCRPSTSSSITIANGQSQQQSVGFSSHRKKVSTKVSIPSSPIEGLKLEKVMDGNGGDLLSIMLAFFAAVVPMDPGNPEVKSMNTGVQCALDNKDNAQAFKTALYGKADAVLNKVAEDKIATKLGINCDTQGVTTPEHKCYCGEVKNTIMYCGAVKYGAAIKTPKGMCKTDALAALKTAAPHLGPLYDWDALSKNKAHDKTIEAAFKGDVNAIEAIDKALIAFFCEADDPAVEAAYKTLYASDAMYSLVEETLIALGLGEEGMILMDKACKGTSEWKSSVFGSCICNGEFDKGLSFCVYKAIGAEFKKEGFLTCEKTKEAFVSEKKPSALPKLAPPSAAATSSLLLAPLSVAAALLLRH